jgi:creatinine amidohydrolase
MRSNFVSDLAWPDVQHRIEAGASAILPVGSAAKQHGWHMPMATDQIQAEWFAEKLATMVDALIWPTVTYGPYPAFSAYPGSVTISEASFQLLIENIASEILRFRTRQLFVLNTGLSSIAPIDRAIANLKAGERIRHLAIYTGRNFQEAAERICIQEHGSHADEAETSIMLVLRPEVVVSHRAQASPKLVGGAKPGPLSPTDPTSPNYSPSGSFGDPTLATAEKGQALIDAIIADLLADCSVSD